MEEKPYKSIVIIGHSIGGLVARQAYLCALGVTGTGVLPWASSITQLILLSTANRGSSFIDRNPVLRLLYSVVPKLGRMALIRDALVGSEFITNLRLEWIRVMRNPDLRTEYGATAKVFQFFAEKDEYLRKADCVDVLQFEDARCTTIPNATHNDLLDPKLPSYFSLLKSAVLGRFSDFESYSTTKLSVKKVVILLHGIRDYGKWLETLEEAIMTPSNSSTTRVIRSSYGYFPIIRFLWRPARQAVVEWFCDQYTQMLAENPSAQYYCAAHSNGTFVIANALQRYRGMFFERVYFAGSVLPRSFCWDALIGKQVGFLRNDCASADYPVGFLCAGLERLDTTLGTSGLHGFNYGGEGIRQTKYLAGGHSVGVNRRNFPEIARFLTIETALSTPSEDAGSVRKVEQPKALLTFLSRVAPFLLLVILAGCFSLLVLKPLVGVVVMLAVCLILKML